MSRPHLILKRYNLNNNGSDYKLENVTSKHCPQCNELLFNEIHQPELDYPYVCLYCDENFYNIELKDNNGLSDVDRLHSNRIFDCFEGIDIPKNKNNYKNLR